LQSLISQLATHDITINDEEVVSMYLRVVLSNYT
jgi:hypothetical protein